jgi:hypothetical protein
MFLRLFIEEELGFSLAMSQRCPIGSAYIRVTSPSDRDWLVSNNPHAFLGRSILFVEHNKGINHIAFTYNRECWLMLLAFPSDYWDDEHIRGAVKDFGALISWDKELSNYGALIVKVRVVDLNLIPHSCVISSGNEWSVESWSVPIFILSQRLLGTPLADEELPPEDGSTPHPLPNFIAAANNMHPPHEAQAPDHDPVQNNVVWPLRICPMCIKCNLKCLWLITLASLQLTLHVRICM